MESLVNAEILLGRLDEPPSLGQHLFHGALHISVMFPENTGLSIENLNNLLQLSYFLFLRSNLSFMFAMKTPVSPVLTQLWTRMDEGEDWEEQRFIVSTSRSSMFLV